MNVREAIEALHRLYLDPRVQPTTEVRVEMEHETHHYTGDAGTPDETTRESTTLPIASIAIGPGSDRAVILSALSREDAVVR